MGNEYEKNQILGVCHKILALKQGKVDYEFSKIVGYVIGVNGRTNIVHSLLKDLIKLKNGEATLNHIFLAKEYGNSEMMSALKNSNWYDFALDPSQKNQELARNIQRNFYDKNIHVDTSKQKESNYFIDEDDFASVIDSFINLSMYNAYGIRELITLEVNKLIKNVSILEDEYPAQFEKIVKVFELNVLQRKILFFYYLLESVDKFDDFIKYTSLDYTERKNAPSAFSKILNISISKIKRELRSNSKLSQSILLEVDDKDINISDHIYDFLQNDDESGDIFSFFFEKSDTSKCLEIEKHRIKKQELDAFKYLVKCSGGSNMLLHGAPGTGKTEFSKSFGKSNKLEIYKIKTHNSDADDMLKEKRSALIAAKSILNQNSILVVDEAEGILGSNSSPFFKDTSDHKAWLNTFMEEHSINIIWITNDMTMHESTKRRFDLSICFESFTRGQRLDALESIQSRIGVDLFNKIELKDIAKNYSLDPGSLSLSFRKMGSLEEAEFEKKGVIITLLNSHMKLIKGKEVTEKPLESFYNPNFINASINEKEIVSVISSYYQDPNRVRNICILFQGDPGTGKTEFAKYISEELGRKMNVKRASDILDKYVGEAEKNIAGMFSQVERENDILFIDECDSLFKSRETAEMSWMVSQTNELLTQMERFKGVLICATNFVENLDRAAMRRFHLKIEFKELCEKKLPDVYRSFFSKITKIDLNVKELDNLKRIKGLNPGDFKAVYNSIVFKKNILNKDIISRLQDESYYKVRRNSIGLKG